MNELDLINQKLGTNYIHIVQASTSKEALATCFNDERLYKYINEFYMQAWTDENQDLFADISEDYIKKGYSVPYYLKIKNPKLLTNCYLYGSVNTDKIEPEALNEENIKLAFEKNNFNPYIFVKNPMALKVFLINKCKNDIKFQPSAWNEENATLYIQNMSEFPRLSGFNNIICFKEVIRNHRFDLISDFYFGSSPFDNEIGDLLYQKMIEFPEDIVELKVNRLNNIAPYYLKALIETKKINLIESALNRESSTDDNIALLSENIEDYLNATNGRLNYFLSNNSKVLDKLIELKRFDIIYSNFPLVEWSYDEIKSYFDLNLEKKYYDRFEHNALALKVYIQGNFNLNINFSNWDDKIVWNDENIELYFDYLQRKKPDTLPLYTFSYIDDFLNKCLERNVFKYLDKGSRDINQELLCQKIREFPNEVFVLNTNFINSVVLEAMIDAKNFKLIDKYANWCHDNINEVVFSKFAEILDDYLKCGYKIPSNLCKSPKVLKKKIELNNFDNFTLFSSTWDEETITLITNKYIQDYINFNNIPCRDKAYLHYAIYHLNVIKANSYYYGYNSYKDPFFRYLDENRICDINELLRYFKNRKVLDEYIKDGYLTDKFKQILIFNHGYQSYCRENNIDIFENIKDQTLLSYLKCAYKVENLHKGIFINETNYKEYFDEKGPKLELYNFLFNANSLKTFKTLIDTYPNDKVEKIKIYAAEKLLNMKNKKIIKQCIKYFFKENTQTITEKKVDDLLKIVNRIEYSNSLEMHNFIDQILENVLESENPYEKLDKIENIFLKDKVPMFSKAFICFKTLYPEFQKYDQSKGNLFDFSENSRISPDLLSANPNNKRMQLYKKIVNGDKTKIRFQLIFNDLLRCSINSQNETLIKYLNTLKEGNDCTLKLLNNNFDINKLEKQEQEILEEFISYLSVIYENATEKKLTENLIEKTKILLNYFKPTNRYSLADRVVRSFGYFAGIDSLEQIEKLINNATIKTEKENEELANFLEKNKLRLRNGDLIRGIGNFEVIGSSLENGNVCKELLGAFIGKSDSDTTPLDVDLTLTEEKDNIYNSINGTPTGWGFGNIFVILKHNYTITRDKDGNILETEYDPMKMEVFGTKTKKGGYETHWGGRSGFDSTNIKSFIYKKRAQIDSTKPYNEDGTINYRNKSDFDDLPYVKFEIARHGLYIPIVDLSGQIIFTKKEYDEIRKKMMGLSKYNCEKYEIEKESLYFEGIEKLIEEMSNDRKRVENIREKICKKIEEMIINSDLDIEKINKTFKGDLSSGICELYETGSTSRFSNVPNDSDFDFMLKIDRKYISNEEKMKEILNIIQKELKPKENIPTKRNRFRGTGIKIENYEDLDIDISINQRRNNNTYSSEMSLNDRYESIKKQYPNYYPLVLANVVKAKQILKEEKIYKTIEGGIGGIGVENWILQNGGSFKKAAQDFVNHAYDKEGKLLDFEKFKTIYQIFDFGSNHEPKEKTKGVYYPFDNYIADNMTKETYEKMSKLLKEYLKNIETEKNVQK